MQALCVGKGPGEDEKECKRGGSMLMHMCVYVVGVSITKGETRKGTERIGKKRGEEEKLILGVNVVVVKYINGWEIVYVEFGQWIDYTVRVGGHSGAVLA